MSGIVALSINPDVYYSGTEQKRKRRRRCNRQFVDDLFWLTFYLQHLGQGYSGLATLPTNKKRRQKKSKILPRTHRGLFRDTFKKDLRGFRGPLGIGHISAGVREPYYMEESPFPLFAICFAGCLINREKIIEGFIKQGRGFERSDDIVLISQLIVEPGWDKSKSMDENFIRGLTYMTEHIQGAYALSILTEKKIYVVRGPDGHETLALGRKNGAVIIASESDGFYNQGFELERDIEAGEVIALENGIAKQIGIIKTEKEIKLQPCSFKYVYTASPPSVIFGISADEVRRRLGACSARRDIKAGFIPHLVIPIPDSGRFHAIGYHQEFVRQILARNIEYVPLYDEHLIKYPYAGRSYTPADPIEREIEAKKKIIPVMEYELDIFEVLNIFGIKDLMDKDVNKWFPIEINQETGEKILAINIVIVDDSIVTGNQTTSDLVPKERSVKIKIKLRSGESIKAKVRIHFRISNPKLISICPWGKANKEKEKLAAYDEKTGRIISNEEIAKNLGIASCRFNTVEDVAEAIGIPLENLCVDCGKLSEE